jgi:VTC domain.
MFLNELHTVLDSFSPITLEEMDCVKLMNRFDTKYVFSSSKLPAFLKLLAGNYTILEISGARSFNYNTIYLDTPQYLFYNQHVTGKLSRHKVRYRTYENTGATFLEVKRKTNQYRTLKWRVKNNFDTSVIDDEASGFIKKHILTDKIDLNPVMRNRFTRSTLVGTDSHERITIDYMMDFTAMKGTSVELPFIVIVELKSESVACHSPFGSAVRQSGIHPLGFSKYCIGNALLLDVPRKNILKQRLLLLKKIENEYLKSSGS